jgi:NADH:ubiquinone oxidoreductase subunit 5 (subunit L)/multisubunit Na+/H+ antiporter MnhA subunit
MKYWSIVLMLFFAASVSVQSQNMKSVEEHTTKTTIYLLPNVYTAVVIGNDTVACMYLKDFIKYSPIRHSSAQEVIQYHRLIRDVKKTLPYAKDVASIIIETYEYMETLPDHKAKQKHLEKMEKYLKDAYTPKMKKLTRTQGQLLMKLIDRETNSSSYHIVESFMGPLKAWSYNMLAGIFGNSLKKRYNPYDEDRMIERVAVLVEQGAI